MEVILGTYDEVILGFRVVEIGGDLQIEASFTDNSHAGSVRSVAISKSGILASGSADETIRLFNLKRQKELGSLIHHDGSVTSLDFHKNFMFSTSDDGKLCIWKTFTWDCLRTLKGHKSGVNYVSVHPTGKLALTVGKDRSLRTWNLITGRSAFITNLHQVADIVKWSPEGDKYLIVVQNKIDVYSVETAEVIQTVQSEGRINCIVFINNDVCCYGGEGGTVTFHNITATKQVHVCETNTTRIKGLCISCCRLRNQDKQRVLTIASSEGIVKLYTLTENKDEISTELLVEHNSGFRVTCMAVYSTKESKQKETTTSIEESVGHNVDSGVDKSDNVDTGSENDKQDSDVEAEITKTVRFNSPEAKHKQKGNKNRKRPSSVDTQQNESKKMKTKTKVIEGHKNVDSTKQKQPSTDIKSKTESPVSTTNSKKKNKRKRKSGKKE